ncbi:DNA primase small subunit [Ceratina calcarata]|uniref:DNA primase n=1 Tax=Ceratina calcarata TaxID=156304 RepID=A0AAJ7IVA1_9HYME|nr:DNA primase small subunit [Ceratina calcarata]
MGDVSNLIDLLPIYYSRLFPFEDYYRWLSYGKLSKFSHREFSFTVMDDIYLRFQSYKNPQELETEIKRLLPFKIDLGAIYNISPREQHMNPRFRPVERELVFDIDMTDYDEVRTCCSGAGICSKCWKFMALACKILDSSLRLDFGYKHILWVFSGRRGIHCWVCDKAARKLTVSERSAVAEYLQLIEGGEYMGKKVRLGENIPQCIRRALQTIENVFVPFCVEEQDILGTEERVNQFLKIISDDECRDELKLLFDKCSSSKARWNAFVNYIKNLKTTGNKKWSQHRHIVEEVMLQFVYPRLDINVTKGMNHLLKSPFCIHPKTGKVCIPFTAKTVDKFQPENVPTIMTLIEEINEFDEKNKIGQDMKRIRDYKKTSLNRSMHMFREFIWNLDNKGDDDISEKMEF